MAANLINIESDNSLSFGDYSLNEKSKAEDFPYEGNLMKVKTFKEITKLEKNGMFVYESVPGTSVYNFTENADGVAFFDDAQITVGLEDETEYEVIVDDVSVGKVKTNLGGKLNFSLDLSGGRKKVVIKK